MLLALDDQLEWRNTRSLHRNIDLNNMKRTWRLLSHTHTRTQFTLPTTDVDEFLLSFDNYDKVNLH